MNPSIILFPSWLYISTSDDNFRAGLDSSYEDKTFSFGGSSTFFAERVLQASRHTNDRASKRGR